jgi:nucleoside-diphosphate-sugar epimerase
MRLDLVINTMFANALEKEVITVNNPSIWRPILSISDAVDAYVRSIEAPLEISGVFNVASGNYTIGAIADDVAEAVSELLHLDVRIDVKAVRDLRNYKVSWEKASNVIGFHPKHAIKDIVRTLYENRQKFSDSANPSYYNLPIFKALRFDVG